MMIDLAMLPAYIAAAAAVTLAPGPDTIFVLATGVQTGTRAGIAATLGIATGCLAHAAMAALGLSALIAASPVAFDVLRIAGAIYLLWIGAKALHAAAATWRNRAPLPAQTLGEATVWQAYRRGAITNVLNPKVGIFYMAFLPQFANPALGNLAVQILLLAAIHIVLGIIWLSTLAAVSGRATASLARNNRVRAWLDGVAGTIYIALGVRMFITERR